MGEFFGHLKDTKWLDWKGWFCACCCAEYVCAKVAYDVSNSLPCWVSFNSSQNKKTNEFLGFCRKLKTTATGCRSCTAAHVWAPSGTWRLLRDCRTRVWTEFWHSSGSLSALSVLVSATFPLSPSLSHSFTSCEYISMTNAAFSLRRISWGWHRPSHGVPGLLRVSQKSRLYRQELNSFLRSHTGIQLMLHHFTIRCITHYIITDRPVLEMILNWNFL